MDKLKFKQFELPAKILQQLYELTGGAKCYKGFIIAYCNEDGKPIIETNCESQITKSGLIKCIESYTLEYSQNIFEEESD